MTLRAAEMVIMYLFGIGGHLGALGGEFDFPRWSLGEMKCLFLSSTGKCQVELMKIGCG